jgi:hypothetical protein
MVARRMKAKKVGVADEFDASSYDPSAAGVRRAVPARDANRSATAFIPQLATRADASAHCAV